MALAKGRGGTSDNGVASAGSDMVLVGGNGKDMKKKLSAFLIDEQASCDIFPL